tara:strand:- start:1102 stop:2403 length:1302 start_codon:yes stop_codon:yes gene_type:complete
MNFDLDIDKYSKDDYFDIFDLDKNINPTRNTIEDKHKTLLNNLKDENIESEEKEKITVFLMQCKNNLLTLLGEDKYKLIETDFIHDLDNSETFQNNNNFVIKKNGDDRFHTNKINPFAKQTKTQLLNVNTKFRKEYYNTNATDFILDLPEEFKNVVSLTIQSVQIPNSNYTFSSSIGTNEFTVELFDLNSSGAVIGGTQIKKVIKIQDGIYTGPILKDYLNTYVFSDLSLNRIGCDFDLIARKFRFFRDYRSLADGGQPVDPTGAITYAFNIDWRLSINPNTPIQLNMGWILGYRQQYYDWGNDYTDSSGVSYNRLEGYNPEAIYDTLGTKYYILSLDDFNKNYSNTLTSPFQESVFNDQNAIAKIPNNPNLQQLDDIFYQSRREYFGPVNIKRLKVRLLDELGRVVDLNNTDYSFSVVIEQLYDAHANKIFN